MPVTVTRTDGHRHGHDQLESTVTISNGPGARASLEVTAAAAALRLSRSNRSGWHWQPRPRLSEACNLKRQRPGARLQLLVAVPARQPWPGKDPRMASHAGVQLEDGCEHVLII